MSTDFNINNLVRHNIKKLKAYASARDEYSSAAKEMVFLDANENPFNNGVNRYPDPHQVSVKQVVSEIKSVPQENIVLGNGSDEVLDLIFRVFCEPKEDNIITLPPTYGMYEVLANLNNIEIKEVLLTSSFQPDYNTILKTITANTKLLFLCTPNNPTANSFKANTVEKLLKSFQGIVVIDEAYIDFSEQESWVSRLHEFPNLIVTQTLSKAYGLAGIRLGICYASKQISSLLKKIKPPYNVNALTQQKAISRLTNSSVVKNEVEIIIKERKRLEAALTKINFVLKIYPSEANFLLVKVDDANKRYSQLIAKGIVVRNRTNQPLCDNCLRFTVGTSIENIKLIEALKVVE